MRKCNMGVNVLELVGLLLVGWSCVEQPKSPQFPPIALESKYIQMGFAATEGQPCEEWLRQLDSYVEYAADTLGISYPNEKIPVYVYDSKELQPICGSEKYVGGCYYYDSNGVHGVLVSDSSIDSIYHEIVHYLLIRQMKIRPHALFDEGMAEAISNTTCDSGYVAEIPLEYVLNDEQSINDYKTMGFFFRYLIETYGMDAVLEWGRSVGTLAGADKLQSKFETQFGITLETAWSNDWAHAAMPVPPVVKCMGEEVEWEGGEWHHSFSGSCSDDTIRALSGSHIYQQVKITIYEDGDYYVDSPLISVEFTRCGECGGIERQLDVGSGVASFSAGEYSVIMPYNMATPEQRDVLVRPIRSCNPFDDNCPADEKCIDVGNETFSCVPLHGDEDPLGAWCVPSVSFEFPVVSNTDSCGRGLQCAHNRCRPRCSGSFADPECTDGRMCFQYDPLDYYAPLSGYSLPGACFVNCNPLASNCADGEQCLSTTVDDTFVCTSYMPTSLGEYGTEWCLNNACGEGLYCAYGELVVPNTETDVLGVCTAVCDPANTDGSQCPDADSGQICKPHPSVEGVGYCTMEELVGI